MPLQVGFLARNVNVEYVFYAEIFMTRVSSTAKSHSGWSVVSYMEADPDLVKEEHGLDIDNLRAHKKKMMQHNRCDLSHDFDVVVISLF